MKKFNVRALNARERMLVICTVVAFGLLFTKNFVLKNRLALASLIEESRGLEQRLTALKAMELSGEGAQRTFTVPLAEVAGLVLNPLYLSEINLLHSQFLKSTDEGGQTFLTTTLRLSGDFTKISHYVAYLESLLAPWELRKFASEKDEADQNLLRVELTGVIYGAL